MEKPTERTRAGMARDSDASTPGPTMASEASMPALPTKATGTLGARAKSTANPAAITEATASIRKTSPMSRAASRVAISAPTKRPRRSKTWMGAISQARWTASRWNVCWYCSEASDVKPAMDAAKNGRAMKMRRSTLIFHTVRQASPKEGAGSARTAGSAAAGAPATSPRGTGSPRSDASICSLSCSCSCRPRTGSRRRVPISTTTAMGTAKKKKGARHDQTAARPAPRITPMMAPRLMPDRWAEYTRGRTGTE